MGRPHATRTRVPHEPPRSSGTRDPHVSYCRIDRRTGRTQLAPRAELTPVSRRSQRSGLLQERIHGFDLLRGLCALAVAIYHMLLWSGAPHPHSWGLFGVYIFFVLSGASMVVAYRERFEGGFSAAEFMFLRFIRLAPLFAIAVLLNARNRQEFASGFLNLTFLFGLGNPGATSWVVGGWSLGIEFAFYLMFPVLLSISGGKGRVWAGVVLAIAQSLFVHMALGGGDQQAAWVSYTQPLSFAAYFYFGCLIGHAVLDSKTIQFSAAPFLLGFVLILLGSAATAAETLTGVRGTTLMLLSILVTYFAAGLPLKGPMQSTATFLGDASYGVYLLHPFAFNLAKRANLGTVPTIIASLVLAFASAWALLHYFETPVRLRARRWLDTRGAEKIQPLVGR